VTRFGDQPAKSLLRENGLTILDFARRHELNPRHAQTALNGEIAPSVELQHALCRELGQPITRLFVPEALATGPRLTGNSRVRAV
jgi:transcriptional regulator with XRE-family HTH domain